MAIAGTVVLALQLGLNGVLGGLVLTGIAVLLSLSGVSRLKVYENGMELWLGPFGLVRKYISRQEARLKVRDNIFYQILTISVVGGPVVGPFRSVQMWDLWPEEALREGDFHFID